MVRTEPFTQYSVEIASSLLDYNNDKSSNTAEEYDKMEHMCFMITKASWRDLNAILRLEQVCFAKDAWTFLDVAGALIGGDIIRFKATCGDELAGFAAAEIRKAEHAGWIITLGVFPQYRNQGIGSALLQTCEKALLPLKIRLCVSMKNNEAIHLYKNIGYREIGIWPSYYADHCDAIVMEKNEQETIPDAL